MSRAVSRNRFVPAFLLLAALLAVPSPAGARQEPIRIGVASMITPVDTVKYYQAIIEYIGERIRHPVQMVHRRTYEEMDDLLERGEVQIAFICSAPYVRNRAKFGVEILAAPEVGGSPMYRSYIIVHTDSPVRSFPELKGKSFAFTDPRSNSGRIYPVYLLKTMGHDPDRFFGRVLYSYSHNKSIEMVAKKIVDGAAVESLVYEYLRKSGSPYTRRTRILQRSPPFGIPPVVAVRNIDPVLRRKVQEALLSMRDTAKGKAILEAMMIDGFAEVPDSNYDGVRQMERAVAKVETAPPAAKSRDHVLFGVIPRDNPRILYEKYQPLLDYLSAKTPYSYELVLRKNYEEMVEAMATGEADVALLGPLTYLEAHARYGALCILKPKGADGTARYRSVVIRKAGTPPIALSDLKGKRVAFAASKSTSGNLIPRYLLAGAGIHLDDLKGFANYDYHDSVVKAVLKGQYDAGAVRDSVARKYAKLGIAVIARSEEIPTGPLVAGPGIPYQVMETIRKALLELTPDREPGRTVLTRLDEDLRTGFTAASDEDYAGIRAKFNAVPQTCGKGCHPKIQW
ncbi:MAG: hypothetical protein Kow00128_01450 [Deltaproteobacteria bacterium]